MLLEQLSIVNLRNLLKVKIPCHPKLNVFVGPNGSGKTALLEAIFLLACGKSFRTHRMSQVIAFDSPYTLVRAQMDPQEDAFVDKLWLGIQRFQTGEIQLRYGDVEAPNMSALAQALAIQLINHNSFQILESGPESRRQFLNWGVFHVEPSFLMDWQRYQRALKQRNTALKAYQGQYYENQSIQIWDQPLAEAAEAIHLARKRFLERFLLEVETIFAALLSETGLGQGFSSVKIDYVAGWREAISFREALKESFSQDCLFKHTRVGPHRADLALYIDGILAKEVLSRGQIKLFAIGLLIARAKVLLNQKQRKSIFLVDDLQAELDPRASSVVLSALEALDAQIFLTGIDETALKRIISGKDFKMFHVEHFQEQYEAGNQIENVLCEA